MSTSFPDMFSLKGKTAVLTGASRGIGAAMAIALAEAGADVILVQRDKSNTETQDTIKSLGRNATIVECNLSDPTSVRHLIPSLTAAGHEMHILVCAAGIQSRHPAHLFPDDAWDQVLQVNLSAVFTLNRDFGNYLLLHRADSQVRSRGGSGKLGSIINLASLLSFSGGITVPAYAASKGGITQLTKSLSNEWAAHHITVNAIAPGYVDTEMNSALVADGPRAEGILARIPVGRWGKPEDFKGPVVFLASEASRYVTGEVLVVDGGWMGR